MFFHWNWKFKNNEFYNNQVFDNKSKNKLRFYQEYVSKNMYLYCNIN